MDVTISAEELGNLKRNSDSLLALNQYILNVNGEMCGYAARLRRAIEEIGKEIEQRHYCGALEKINKAQSIKPEISSGLGSVSDGYHTFDELYDHRVTLFGALCLAYPALSWKSRLHSDGTSMDGWFVAGMRLPSGMITYHIPDSEWSKMFYLVTELELAPKWDGHTPADVVQRLREIGKTGGIKWD